MTDQPFRVQTVELDLPSLAAAFCARLHDAGLPVTPTRTADLARSLTLVRPVSRRRLYWSARSVLVSDQSQVAAFDRVFLAVFGDRDREEPFRPDEIQATAAPPEEDTATDRRLEEAQVIGREPQGGVWSSGAPLDGSEDGERLEVPMALASEEERLAIRSFDLLQPYELAQLHRLMSGLRLATPVRRTRRHRTSRRGRRIDMRRTLRTSLRTGGDPIRLARRRRREVPRRLVMLCDISGSMEPYARAYLQFLSCGAGAAPDAEAFVFATRLTRVTRALAARNPQRAIQRAAEAAPDWSSGTRIGEALKRFNDRHGRRGMARGAVVVILSDGWERGDPDLVAREMERLLQARAPDRVGEPADQRRAVRRPRRRDGRCAAALRRAGQRPQLCRAGRGRGGDRRRAGHG